MLRAEIKRDPHMQGHGRGVNRFYVCAAEGCENRLNEVTVKNLDPFCSTSHCKEYHGVEIQLPKPGFPVGASA